MRAGFVGTAAVSSTFKKPKTGKDMRELKCPKCGSVFSVDEADYASIVSQVKGAEFDAEVNHRIAEFCRQQEAEGKVREISMRQEHQNELFKKDQAINEKESEIARLKDQLAVMDDRQKLAVGTAVAGKDKEIDALKATIGMNARELEIAILKERQQAQQQAQAKDAEIAELKSKAKVAASEAELREKSLQAQYEDKINVVRSGSPLQYRL